MDKYCHNTNGSTELVLVKQNFLLRGIRDSRTLIVQVLIGAMHGLVVSILVIRNFALTEFALARLHCTILSVHCQTGLTVGEYLIFGGCGLRGLTTAFSRNVFLIE